MPIDLLLLIVTIVRRLGPAEEGNFTSSPPQKAPESVPGPFPVTLEFEISNAPPLIWIPPFAQFETVTWSNRTMLPEFVTIPIPASAVTARSRAYNFAPLPTLIAEPPPTTPTRAVFCPMIEVSVVVPNADVAAVTAPRTTTTVLELLAAAATGWRVQNGTVDAPAPAAESEQPLWLLT
jgi:hypothetical protein